MITICSYNQNVTVRAYVKRYILTSNTCDIC